MTDKKVFTANVGYQCRIAEHAQNPTESDETRQSNETDVDTYTISLFFMETFKTTTFYSNSFKKISEYSL